jgi:hypothetical protein
MQSGANLAIETTVGALAYVTSSVVLDELVHIGSSIPILSLSMVIIKFVIGAALIRFKVQSIVLDLLLPCVVIADIHGNFHRLIQILASIQGSPHDEPLLLGEYVDHSQYPLDVLMLLFSSSKA